MPRDLTQSGKMFRAFVVCIVLSILSQCVLASDAPQSSNTDICWILMQSVEALNKAVDYMQSQEATRATVMNNLVSSIKNLVTLQETQASLLWNLTARFDEQATLLNSLHNRPANAVSIVRPEKEESSKHLQNGTTNRVAEGIIVGTAASGVVLLSLDSLKQRTISDATPVSKVAFDWNSRKVYRISSFIEPGLYRANLDGSGKERLRSDTDQLRGLAVDEITGNFYYIERGRSNRIRVCDNSGRKYAVVAYGTNIIRQYIHEISLDTSRGLMYWSNPIDKKNVIRASMDGKNATVVISDDINGICLDEVSQRLYCVSISNSTLGYYNLNGSDRSLQYTSTIVGSGKIAVGENMVYFTDTDDDGIMNHINSVTQDGTIDLVTNEILELSHIQLYGRMTRPSRRNPCENSPCPNVCVLNPESFTCL